MPSEARAAYARERWRAACRVALLSQPLLGATQVAELVGPPTNRLVSGWNATVRLNATGEAATAYVFLDPAGAQGRTTFTRPDVPADQLHSLDLPTRLEDTALWALLLETGAAAVQANIDTPEHVALLLGHIQAAVGPAGTAMLQLRLGMALQQMRSTVAAARRYPGEVDYQDLFLPARDLVRAYLACEISGMVVRELLAVLLSAQRQVPDLGSPQQTPPAAREELIDHLFTQAQALAARGEGLDVASFYDAYYLAELYADTAHTLAAHALELAEAGSPERRRASGLIRNIEEWAAYHLRPTFLPPLLPTPQAILQWAMDRRRPDDANALVTGRRLLLHPALLRLLEPPDQWRERSEDEVLRDYQAGATAGRALNVADALAGTLDPVSPAAHAEVQARLAALD